MSLNTEKEHYNYLVDEMGFSPHIAQQALKESNYSGVEAAITWITEHGHEWEDAQTIPVQSPDVVTASDDCAQANPAMDPQEALKKATELQKELREERAKREKSEAIEAEKKRIQMHKSLVDAQRAREEYLRKQAIAEREADRQAEIAERARILRQLKEDREARYKEGEAPDITEEIVEEERTGKTEVAYRIAQLWKYSADNAHLVLDCITTLYAYISNILKSPMNAKYRTVNKQNAIFKSRILPFEEHTIPLLKALGFEEAPDEYMELIGDPEIHLLEQALKFLELLRMRVQQSLQ